MIFFDGQNYYAVISASEEPVGSSVIFLICCLQWVFNKMFPYIRIGESVFLKTETVLLYLLVYNPIRTHFADLKSYVSSSK